jgi:hypothetical protein
MADPLYNQVVAARFFVRLHPECVRRGESAKLDEGNVRFIFKLRSKGWKLQRIADEFGVSFQTIHLVLARKRWAHVDLEVSDGH